MSLLKHVFHFLPCVPQLGKLTNLFYKYENQLGAVVHTSNSTAWEAEGGGPQVQSQHLSEALDNLARVCLNRAEDVAQCDPSGFIPGRKKKEKKKEEEKPQNYNNHKDMKAEAEMSDFLLELQAVWV